MIPKSIVRLTGASSLLVGLLAVLPALSPLALGADRRGAPPSAPVPGPVPATERTAFLKRILPALSTQNQKYLAKSLGVGSIHGKFLPGVGRPPIFQTMDSDHQVTGGISGVVSNQNQPSIAASPLDDNIVVVFAQNENSVSLPAPAAACSIYISFDGGQTYTYDSDADLTGATDEFCSNPVARFSPDGQTLYLSYNDQALGASPDDEVDTVRVQVRDGIDPTTVLGTSTVFTGTGGVFIDRPWVDVHTWDADGSGAPFVYITATRFNADDSCEILFSRNDGSGLNTWDTPQVIASSGGAGSCDVANPATARLLQGSRPAGGPGQQVLVCWFDAGTDGWSTGVQQPLPPLKPIPLNKFNIACRSSQDRGLSFAGDKTPPESVTPADPTHWIYAAKAVAYEVPYFLGPNDSYHHWFGSQLPAVAIDHLGNAHVVFTYKPTSAEADAESGNVAYIKSTNFVPTTAAPTIYSKWSAKAALGTGALAQGFPTVVAQKVNQATKPTIWVSFVDHTRSSALGPTLKNAVYDVRYRKSLTGGPSFSAAVTVTPASSLSDDFSLGDYIDSSATRHRFNLAWTDNVNANTSGDDVSDIFSIRY